MEIKRVNKESYESISAYLDVLLSVVPTLDDLCFVDYDGKRYLLSITEDGIGIVENDNGELNPYFYGLKDEDKKVFETEEFKYETVCDSDIKEVRRVNNLTNTKEIVAFLPPISNHPRAILEYRQIINEGDAGLISRYDVTIRKEYLDSCLSYANYHSPDTLELRVLKEFLFLYLQKKYVYSKGMDDENYYSPLIKLGNFYLGAKRTVYDPEQLIQEIANFGFQEKIPADLGDYLLGVNQDYKKLSLIGNEYKNFIKEQ